MDCAQGRSSLAGSTTCSSCAAGKMISEDGSCTSCPAGFAQKEQNKPFCEQCGKTSKGETSAEGASLCLFCDSGRYQTSPGVCSACGAGKYQDGKGAKQCKSCPVDTYLADEGKSSKADCGACESERSTGVLEGQTNSSSCLCRKGEFYTSADGNCTTCPNGADCTGTNGIVLSEMIPRTSFWRSSTDSAIFLDCKRIYVGMDEKTMALKSSNRCCPPGQCNGTRRFLGSTNTTAWNPDTQCLEGYSGPMCG